MSALAPLPALPALPRAAPRGPLARGRGLRLLLRAGLMTLASVALVGAALTLASLLLASRGPAEPASAGGGAAHWTEIRQPIALYDLTGTDFAKLPSTYLARNHEPDGAREDVLTFGRLGDGGPFLQLSLVRTGEAGGDTVADRGLLPGRTAASDDGRADADALAQLAGSRGLTATRLHRAAEVDTRLGPMASADLLLSDGGAAVPCLGFRSLAGRATVLRVAGFACGAQDRPLGRAALACALDRIDLISAGEDAALRAVFVAAERRGVTACPGAGAASLLGGGRRLGWLDPDATMPPLRGLFDIALHQR